jgi:hypothetical protein
MRLARNLFLLAATAVVALAFASTASASGLEVVDEHSPTTHCPEVQTNGTHDPTGGCHISAETEGATTADLAIHIPGSGETVFSQCTNTFEARIHETGDALIYNQVLAGANCGREPCDEAEAAEDPHANIPWPAHLSEFNPNTETLGVTFCVREHGEEIEEGEGNTPCTVGIPINLDGPHAYEFNAPSGSPNPIRCSQNHIVSLTGHWVLSETSEDEIEIVH